MINQKEKLEIMEKFFWRLNYHRTHTMNEKSILTMLQMMDRWVNAHSDHNGERPQKDVKANVQAAYEMLKTLP